MNDFLTARIPLSTLAGDIAPDLVTNFGPGGNIVPINVPEGFAARLYDFAVYELFPPDGRYGVNLVRTPVPRDGVRAWSGDQEVLDDGGVLAALGGTFVSGTGDQNQRYPHTEHLWPLDYRLVMAPRITGFTQVSRSMGFRVRYQLVRASRKEVAAILFWQNQGVKVA